MDDSAKWDWRRKIETRASSLAGGLLFVRPIRPATASEPLFIRAHLGNPWFKCLAFGHSSHTCSLIFHGCCSGFGFEKRRDDVFLCFEKSNRNAVFKTCLLTLCCSDRAGRFGKIVDSKIMFHSFWFWWLSKVALRCQAKRPVSGLFQPMLPPLVATFVSSRSMARGVRWWRFQHAVF